MRDFQTSVYKKQIAVTKEDHYYLEQVKIKGRKTKAGKLEEILIIFRKEHPEYGTTRED